MKIYIIAGEASGDLHGSNLIKAINKIKPDVKFRCWGGDKMHKAGAKIVKHIKDLAFMGFIEVLLNLRTILNNISFCKRDIINYSPDAIVLIDYPGFNIRISTWAKTRGIPVYYYISPQIWAWKQSRVYKLKSSVEKIYTILPFEKEFYKKFNMDVEYVGHPLLEEILNYLNKIKSKSSFIDKNNLLNKPIIAILPGSRKQEINVKLPLMLKAAREYNQYQIIVAGAPNIDQKIYYKYGLKEESLIYGNTYEIITYADAAIVTSGTATLETALLGTPEVVCYKGSRVSYLIARLLIKVKYISLVNLIMNKQIVVELIQNECTPKQISKELNLLLNNFSYREKMLNSFTELRTKLGEDGASQKVAQSLIYDLSNHKR